MDTRHSYFGLIKIGMIFDIEETLSPLTEEVLPNGIETIYELMGLSRRHLFVSSVFPRKLLNRALRRLKKIEPKT